MRRAIATAHRSVTGRKTVCFTFTRGAILGLMWLNFLSVKVPHCRRGATAVRESLRMRSATDPAGAAGASDAMEEINQEQAVFNTPAKSGSIADFAAPGKENT